MPQAVASGGASSSTKGGQHTILEAIELSDDSDEDFDYEELPEDPELLEDDEDVGIDDINKLLAETKQGSDAPESSGEGGLAKVQQRPQVIDDFFRNFLLKYGLKHSLEAFQTEYYELQQSGAFKDSELAIVPDVHSRNQGHQQEVFMLQEELHKARIIAEKAKESWDKFRKERDFHRMHHTKVVQEKNKLIVDLRRLKKHYEQYEPTLTELRHKYESAMKDKMLLRLERDRYVEKADTLERQIRQVEVKDEMNSKDLTEGESKRTKQTLREAPLPPENRTNPYSNSNFEAVAVGDFMRYQTFKGHLGAVSRIAFHPKIAVIATACDDHTWKMWSMPEGQLVLSGEGHKDWVSGIAFHPRGSLVATTSGDCTMKIWDVAKEKCTHTFQDDHKQPVWACAFHDMGDFVVSCSQDASAKAFDMTTMQCRQAFRGHVDSINYCAFQPFSNMLLTASGDKTLSLWDLRTGRCTKTLYGHTNAVNHACFNLKGDTIASCDSDGIVKLWDIRMVSEFLQIDTGQHPANAANFDRSGKVLAIASGDASVKTFNIEDRAFIVNLEGHEDSVQDVVFEPQTNKYLISASSDATFSMWQ